MSTFLGLIMIILASALTVLDLVTAATYNVGGLNGGWDSTTNLQTWASSQTFQVGDNLAFQYAPMHDVVEVPKSDYDSCQTTNVIQSYTGGTTLVPLSSPGKRYFICGTPGHCTQGMKLQIDTLAAAASAPPPASLPSSPAETDLFPDSPAPGPGPGPGPGPAAAGGGFPSALSPEGSTFPPPTGNSLPDLSSSAAGKLVSINDVAGLGMMFVCNSLMMLLAAF